MPVEALSIGPVHDIVQNITYALPAKACYILADDALEVSLSYDSGFFSVAATTTGTVIAAAFVKCTTSNTKVCLKAS